jgi:hypothetical protein
MLVQPQLQMPLVVAELVVRLIMGVTEALAVLVAWVAEAGVVAALVLAA